MQILRRPTTRNGYSNSGRSPPLLQRQASSNLIFMEQSGIMESMDFENNNPTVFFLNVDNLEGDAPENNTEEEIGLGEEDPFTHHYSVQADGSIHYHHQNGLDLGQYEVMDTVEHNFEFEEVATMPSSAELNENNANNSSNGYTNHEHQNTQRQYNKRKGALNLEEEQEEKRPKLVINLYEEDVGYEFGSLSPSDPTTVLQLSPLIPYSEDYLLKAVDREEIPYGALGHLERTLKWARGHLVAQIRDFRRFAKQKSPKSNNKVLRNSVPVIREVLLRPTTASILHDFDRLMGKSVRGWRRRNFNKGSVSSSSEDEEEEEEEDDENDSEFEFETDDGEEMGELNYDQRLELEKEFVNKTAGPLCLDPSPKVALIQNRIQFERLKWRNPNLTPKRLSKVVTMSSSPQREDDDEPLTPQETSNAFLKFVQSVKDRLTNGIVIKDPDPLKLNGMAPFLEYPILDPPTNMEDILKLAPRPEPSTIRPLTIDNFVKKIEEYTLETERRKRPHTTKLSIYQRNGMDCYYGELEMESIQDGNPISNKPGAGLHKEQVHSNTTKCQFDLGSAQSVALYVKQFSDIFTEDGRRPCKITYQKVGQAQPQVLYTNSYKPAAPATPTASSTSTPNTVTSTTTQMTTPTTQTQPPVQIVLPQPRSTPPDPLQPSPSVNFNSNNNQQVLTRPQIVSMNLQPTQAQQGQGGKVMPTPATSATASQQQILQQRLLRLKQSQQQQHPQQQTALAKLLLTNIQQNPSSGSRPITVAVQPQPQKAQEHQGKLQSIVNPSSNLRLLPQQQSQSSGQGVNLNVNPSVSVNLNTISLDGLLQSSAQNSPIQTQMRSGPVNILRVNQQQQTNQIVNTGGPVALASQQQITNSSTTVSMQRQYATNLSNLLQSQPNINSQRILINANNGQQITLSNPSEQSTSLVDDSSVPDLSSLLNHQNVQMQQDTHNLNLNLNVNLNSNTVMSESGNQGQGGQGPPPFLVFISPLRSVPVSMNQRSISMNNGTTSMLQQHLNQGTNLSLNLQSIQQQQQQDNTIVTSLAGNNSLITVQGHAETHEDIFGETITPDLSNVKIEPVEQQQQQMSTNTVMIGNTAYSVNVSQDNNKKDSSVITLSDLLGSSSTPSSNNTPTLSSLILHNSGNNGNGQMRMSSTGQQGSITSSVVSSTPRLSALLAGTPSADSSIGLVNTGVATGVGVRRLSSTGNNNVNTNDPPRTLLDRLTASISSSSQVAERRSGGSGLNPIASATPNVVLDHPVLAATLTGQQVSPKVVSAYRQIKPAPTNSPGGRGKHQ